MLASRDSTQEQRDPRGQEPLRRFRHLKRDLFGHAPAAAPMPARPGRIEALGVPAALVEKLILKHLYSAGAQRSDDLARALGVPLSLLEEPLGFLRREALIEVRGERGNLGNLLYLSLSDSGRSRAHGYMAENAYCGRVPVPLAQYIEQVQQQTVREQTADAARARAVFDGLVVRDEVIENFGAAFNSGGSLFLYGPPGTGKSFLAGQLVRLLSGDVAIPYAVEIHGQIVQVFDAASHEAVEGGASDAADALVREPEEGMDARWVRCRRPVIVAGGELAPEMLDLAWQPDTGFYEAPLQMKANGGIFFVDDLGRQAMDTAVFLNRWIMPLESGVDYLSLHTGAKFRIPFDVLPVFATNIRPETLVDEAFLRRLGYKVGIDYLSEDEFARIFEQYCTANSLEFDPALVDYLVQQHYRREQRPMVACHPRDLINKVIDFCLYQGRPPQLTRELLDKAWSAYFVPLGTTGETK